MPRKEAFNGKLPPAIGPLSRAIRVGDTLYVSGLVGVDFENRLGEGIEAQTRNTLEGIKSLVEAAGGSMADVVSVTAYLANLEDYKAFNAVYVQYFQPPLPARATVGSQLIHKEHLIELQAVAVIGCGQ